LVIWAEHLVRLRGPATSSQMTSSNRWELTSTKYLGRFRLVGRVDDSISTSNNISIKDKIMIRTLAKTSRVNIIREVCSGTSARVHSPLISPKIFDRQDTVEQATSSMTLFATWRTRASNQTKKRNASQLTSKQSANSQSSKFKIRTARKGTMAN